MQKNYSFEIEKLNRANINVKNTLYKTGEINKEIDPSIKVMNMPVVKLLYHRNLRALR